MLILISLISSASKRKDFSLYTKESSTLTYLKVNKILINMLQKHLYDFKCKNPIEWQNILTEYHELKVYDIIRENNITFAIFDGSFTILWINSSLKSVTWFDCNYEYMYRNNKNGFMYKCTYQPHRHPNYTSRDIKFCSEIIPKLFPNIEMDPCCTWITIYPHSTFLKQYKK